MRSPPRSQVWHAGRRSRRATPFPRDGHIYDVGMSESRPSWITRLLAVLVLVVAAWIVVKVIIGVVAAVAWIVVVVLAIVGVIWAYNTLTS